MRRYVQCSWLASALLVMALTLALATPVSAHAEYKSSMPPDKGTVQQAPSQVMITFSEETNPTKSGGSVTDASGTTVSTGFKVDLNQRTNMTIALKPNLGNGIYTVKWNTFTDDDSGMADGTFTFTIQATAAGTGTAITSTTAATGTTTTNSAASGTVAVGSAAASPQSTATTAATAAVATGTGGGTVATSAPTTLPQTGQSGAGSRVPWLVAVLLIAGAAVMTGSALRRRAASR